MNWLKPITMAGTIADLVPLSPSHLEDLAEAVSDGELWKLWYTFIPEPDHMLAEIERRLKLEGEGSMLPFSVLEKVSGKVVGMTTY
ncbi:MAG TPA: GNAT family N-acetyltransferase, partial [Candidatus Obscuribacter sp.]|nr:GNAT family N-acetyltransferase [Candidatus Obscuribacter sp.]